MSINNAFNLASTGLSANSQWAEMVSGNIANASNDSYGRRSLQMTSTPGGAAIPTGVARAVDASLTRMYREELGRLTRQDSIVAGLAPYTASLGDLDDPGSPAQLLTGLQTSLDMLYNDPSDTASQQSAVQSAQLLARGIRTLAGDLESAMAEVRISLHSDVGQVNGITEDIAQLNGRLARSAEGSEQRAALEDQMSEKLNALAEFMDYRTEVGANGTVQVLTNSGQRLVERDTSFEVSYHDGAGTLMVDGTDISPPRGVTEGRLAAGVELLNDIMPQMRQQLDEFAAAVITSFETTDASLAAGDPGLFTDDGAAFNAANLTGLAQRLKVNDAVVPEAGGAIWRIRDGMGAVTEGSAGQSSQIGAFLDALDGPQSFSSATGLPTDVTLSAYTAALIADQHDTRGQAETERDALNASAASLDGARLSAQGVNIDDELQQLILIEKSFAANSQVISALADMLDSLLAAAA
ncbi:MAG: flagellar hook-associated protein FlgK [Pseudooceanicola sp.]|nr:flagellar hook-associated protein FlgK [Pseudooceanicola sp.]